MHEEIFHPMVAHCNLKSSCQSKTNSLLCHFKILAWQDFPFKWLSPPWNFKVFHIALLTICQLCHLNNLAWIDFPCKWVFDYFISWVQMGLIIRTYWDSNLNLSFLGWNILWKQEENRGNITPPLLYGTARMLKRMRFKFKP